MKTTAFSRDESADLMLEGLDHIDQGVTIFDADLKLVAWNNRFLEMLNFPEILAFEGADFASFIRHNALRGEYGAGDVEQQVAERVNNALKFEKHKFERTNADGRILQVAGTPLRRGGFMTVYTDVSLQHSIQDELERRVAERTEALKLSDERLKLIANEVPAGIAHVDQNLTIQYANTRFAAAYGLTTDQVIGRNAYDVLHPVTMEESARYFEQCRRGALVDFEMTVQLPGRESRDIRTLLRPERPSSGEVIGFYLLSIDVTRQKAMTSALLRSQKMDALGRLASGISHDFNNLLTIILGNLVPLSEQLTDEELNEEYLSPAISAARRGSNLTKRLLTLARREPFDPTLVPIEDAMHDLLKLLRSSLPETISVNHIPSDTPLTVQIDLAQMEMALLNLAMNARDAISGPGSITIETTRYDLQPSEAEVLKLAAGPFAKITVADTGCGMSAEQCERIFEPFFTSKAAGAGFGLGLSMVYGFVRQSNGAIWVNSIPNSGTRFSMLLPLVETPATAETDSAADADIPAPPAASDLDLILVVEDDHEVRRVVRRKITKPTFPK